MANVPDATELKQIKLALSLHHVNGVGFQFVGLTESLEHISPTFYHCQDQISQSDLRQQTGSRTVTLDEWLGRDYITIHWSEYNLIPVVFQYLLDHGCSLRLNSNRPITYRPYDCFIPSEMESRFIQQFESQEMQLKQLLHSTADFRMLGKWPLACEWNYDTLAGKQFAQRLAREYRIEEAHDTTLNFFQKADLQAVCQKYKICDLTFGLGFPSSVPVPEQVVSVAAVVLELSLDSKLEPGPPQEPRQGDPEPCVICQDQNASTLVEPCGHMIVCVACSHHLASTPDAKICVQCRKPIQFVTEISE